MKRLFLIITTLFIYGTAFAQTTDSLPQAERRIIPLALERVKFYGYGQVGYSYTDTPEQKDNNTFDIKRIILMADARIMKNLNAFFMFDFGSKSVLHEFWGEYRFNDALKLRLGQFKVPFSIESLLSPSRLEIINGAQSIMYMAGINGSDPIYGGNAGRDLGVMLSGNLFKYESRKLVSYQLGLFNGQGMNKKDENGHKDVAAWLSFAPLSWATVNGSVYRGRGHALVNGWDIAQGTNYRRNRWSIGTEVTTSPFYIRAEYLRGEDGPVHSEGYYGLANVHLLKKLDLILSYDFLNKNVKVDDKQTNYIVGAQWNFYSRCRLQGQYVYQQRMASLGNANLFQMQLQLGF